RVEAADTAGHWEAVYLARARIPIVRGWFRQDDFPQNELLYDRDLGRRAYLAWLRRLGVRYVVLTAAPSDYSARGEAALIRSGRSELQPVFATRQLRIFAVPSPQPILEGGKVASLTATRIALDLPRAGAYRLAV